MMWFDASKRLKLPVGFPEVILNLENYDIELESSDGVINWYRASG